jgi:hypothetical protein
MRQKKAKRKMERLPEDRQQSGPKPELLKVDSDWEEAVKKSLEKKKPAEGWPK